MIIDPNYVNDLIERNKNTTTQEITDILAIAKTKRGLSYDQIAKLLNIESEEHMAQLLTIAGEIKQEIYGNRIVIFAPLYISNYCVNGCTYCGYKCENKFTRRRLTMPEIREEVKLLEKMGHKRLALEAGEDPVNCDIDYIIEAMKTIYSTYEDNGAIRRVNVNIAATTVEDYKRIKEAGIGTYILFQETYHKETYEKVHPKGPKHNYDYHTTAFDRAMEAGIDDVGAGVLFGLYDYKFEVLSLMLQNAHLEAKYGVGFHTISVPRMKRAEGVTMEDFPYLIDDKTFEKLTAIIRLAVPFVGIILSTRETAEMRAHMLKYGVSQISAGSCTDVGGYKLSTEEQNVVTQFTVEDHRPPIDIIKSLLKDGYIPSYCTACYRTGRTGDRFMRLAKTGQIHNVCTPNALMTLMEYVCDYGDEEATQLATALIQKELANIPSIKVKTLLENNILAIQSGQRDLFL